MWGVWGTGEFTVNFTTFTCGEFHQWCEFMVKFTTCESHQREFTFCKFQTKCEKYVNFTTCENQHEFRLFTHIGRLGCRLRGPRSERGYTLPPGDLRFQDARPRIPTLPSQLIPRDCRLG